MDGYFMYRTLRRRLPQLQQFKMMPCNCHGARVDQNPSGLRAANQENSAPAAKTGGGKKEK